MTEPHPAAGAPKDELEGAQRLAEAHAKLRAELSKVIVGQDRVVEQLLAAVFARGHCLLVGVPGLAKTLLISTLARTLNLTFRRIQFTPDLMPADITGTEVIQEDRATGERTFKFVKGPVFANVVLADEINRAPPKTQAALLEAMQEQQVTAGGRRYPLDRPFFVLATQNPIEQEGTYPLPEAQLDRFMFNVKVDYPSADEELEIVQRTTGGTAQEVDQILTAADILAVQEAVRRVPVADPIVDYAVRLVRATRVSTDDAPAFVREWVRWGAGPRAAQYLVLGAKAHALVAGRSYVSSEDVRAVAHPVLAAVPAHDRSALAGSARGIGASRAAPMADETRNAIDPAIISGVAQIHLRARMVVEGYVSGLHESPYKGFSVEFAEHREYVPGDDLRYLDWKVFGKSDRYYIKQYEEETNLVCHLVVDVSESMDFGTVAHTKHQYATTIAAAIAYLVVKQHDSVGLVLFDDDVRASLQPGSHQGQLRRAFSLLEETGAGGDTAIGKVLARVSERVRRRGLVIVVSDLVGDADEILNGLRRLRSRGHDVVVFHVLDPAELEFPFERMTLFEGLEHHPDLLADPKSLRKAYLEAVAAFRARLRAGCLAERIDLVDMSTRTPLDVALSSYLAHRAARARAGGARRQRG